MTIRVLGALLLLLCFATGCQTSRSAGHLKESREEDLRTLSTLAEAVSGKELSEEELKQLGKEIQKDPEAQSAIQSITESMTGENRIIKYCPFDGKRYAPHLTECPEHRVELEILD